MKIPRGDDSQRAQLNLTSLIDMLFILIIFFLATSRFQQDERDETIELVQSSSSLPIATVNDLLVIDVDKGGQRKINGITKSLEEIEAIVRARLAENEDAQVVVRADKRGQVLHLGQTLEICKRLGIKENRTKFTFSQE
ncbi:MAG: biopolymer transporter ExbD [Planctomycetota bacterium]